MWVTMRADAQQSRDQAEVAGRDTADFDELIRELDEEIAKSGVRGNLPPTALPVHARVAATSPPPRKVITSGASPWSA